MQPFTFEVAHVNYELLISQAFQAHVVYFAAAKETRAHIFFFYMSVECKCTLSQESRCRVTGDC